MLNASSSPPVELGHGARVVDTPGKDDNTTMIDKKYVRVRKILMIKKQFRRMSLLYSSYVLYYHSMEISNDKIRLDELLLMIDKILHHFETIRPLIAISHH